MEAAEETGLATGKMAEDEILFFARPDKRDRDPVRAFMEALVGVSKTPSKSIAQIKREPSSKAIMVILYACNPF